MMNLHDGVQSIVLHDLSGIHGHLGRLDCVHGTCAEPRTGHRKHSRPTAYVEYSLAADVALCNVAKRRQIRLRSAAAEHLLMNGCLSYQLPASRGRNVTRVISAASGGFQSSGKGAAEGGLRQLKRVRRLLARCQPRAQESSPYDSK
eukprot:scaffold205222_cov33-Tisochrysis_lutea.AAC.3